MLFRSTHERLAVGAPMLGHAQGDELLLVLPGGQRDRAAVERGAIHILEAAADRLVPVSQAEMPGGELIENDDAIVLVAQQDRGVHALDRVVESGARGGELAFGRGAHQGRPECHAEDLQRRGDGVGVLESRATRDGDAADRTPVVVANRFSRDGDMALAVRRGRRLEGATEDERYEAARHKIDVILLATKYGFPGTDQQLFQFCEDLKTKRSNKLSRLSRLTLFQLMFSGVAEGNSDEAVTMMTDEMFDILKLPDPDADVFQAVSNGLAALQQGRHIDSLAQALADRKVIERAKGLLMEREKLGEAEAFARLRKASQVTGRPLRVIADAVIATFESG